MEKWKRIIITWLSSDYFLIGGKGLPMWVVSIHSFKYFVQVVGNRAAFFTVSYHQVQGHCWSSLRAIQLPLAGRISFSSWPPIWVSTMVLVWSNTAKKILARHPSKPSLLWPQKQLLPFPRNKNWTRKLRVSWRLHLTSCKWKEGIFKKLVPHLHKEADEGYLCFPRLPDHTPHFGANHFFIGFEFPQSPVQSPLNPSHLCK